MMVIPWRIFLPCTARVEQAPFTTFPFRTFLAILEPQALIEAIIDRHSDNLEGTIPWELRSPRSLRPADEITTISERQEGVDPVLEKLRSLKLTTPILTSPPAESSLTDILVRKPPSSSSAPGAVNPKALLELFSMYRDWQEEKVQKISKNQEEIENKIELGDALAVKLLQRFNYSVSAMKTTSQHLSEVHGLQVEIGELKGRLTEVISNCDALCKRISSQGPEALRSSLTPFPAKSNDDGTCIQTSSASQAVEED